MELGLTRICLLGELRVWRPDGALVSSEEWRTGRTRDLLRLLALDHGRLVRTASLTEKLWPDASPEKARNSLRTAASRIRSAVGTPCVVRRLDGLVLVDAWVDVVEYRELASRARVAARAGDDERVLRLCEAAETLYVGEFHAFDDDSQWARAEREDLRRRRQELLVDGASSALALERFREAVDLGTVAARLDGTSETAHRVLMQGYAALGEVGNALLVFERYRSRLAEALGADPSPQTMELHLELLRGRRS